MKKIPLYLFTALSVLAACKKGNSGKNSTPSTPWWLSSATGYAPQQRIVDSFHYDSLHRIDTVTQSIYDSSSGTPKFNNWMVQFIYQDTLSPSPSWYNYYDIPLGGYGDYHLLSYDAQGRISKDTSLSGSGYVTFFAYPNNEIAITTFYEGTPADNMMDTLFLRSGDLWQQTLYLSIVPGQPDQEAGTAAYTGASAANPAYNAAISAAIGPLLFDFTLSTNRAFVDFVSKNAYEALNSTQSCSPFGISILDFTLTNDDKGRLTRMTTGRGAAPVSIVYTYY